MHRALKPKIQNATNHSNCNASTAVGSKQRTLWPSSCVRREKEEEERQ